MLTSAKPRLLIIEDDEALRTQLKWSLADEYEVAVAESREEALALFKGNRPQVVTLDLGLPPQPNGVTEGFQTLAEILREDESTKVIMMTGRAERIYAIEAIGQGAYDFFCKPIQLEELQVVLRRACHVFQIEQEKRALERESNAAPFEGIIGTSPKM